MNLQAINERLSAEIKRFSPSLGNAFGSDIAEMAENPNGSYITWEDHQAAVAQLQLAIQRIERDTIERCAQKAESQKYGPEVGFNYPAAEYNCACDEIAAAIRSLSSKQQDKTATFETERAALVAQFGDCCQGGDPLCAGGCLVEKAIQKNLAVHLAGSADAHSEHGSVPDSQEPQAMRLTLLVQVHELCDQIERTLHYFGSDAEARKQAEGAVAYARKVSKPYNYNGPYRAALSTTGPMLRSARQHSSTESRPNEQNAVSVLPAVTQAPAMLDDVAISEILTKHDILCGMRTGKLDGHVDDLYKAIREILAAAPTTAPAQPTKGGE